MSFQMGSLVVPAATTGFLEVTGLPFRPNQIKGEHQSVGVTGSGTETPAFTWLATESEEGSVQIFNNGVAAPALASDQMIDTEDASAAAAQGTFQAFTDDGFQIHLSSNTLTTDLIIQFIALRS